MTFLQDALRLLIGFAISGVAASAFEAFTDRRASFRLLREPSVVAVAAVPVVTFGAPYILVRNMLFATKRPRSASAVFAGTVASGLWSLALGAVAVSAFVG